MLHTCRKGPEEQAIPAKGLDTSLSPVNGLASAGEWLLPNSIEGEGARDREFNAQKGQEKKAHFDEPNGDEVRNDPTGLIAEDATTTREGSADSIDERLGTGQT